eukprot:2709099-Ditylum_brightwellii.AAC.1
MRLRDNQYVGFVNRTNTLSKEEKEKASRQKCCFEEVKVKWKQDPAEMKDENEEDRDNALTEEKKQRSTSGRTSLG